ncbi:MAG TPA: hypothetical protein VGO25_00600, partial [Rhodanobacteraceae bacterium]|nr:hypothetical protein [Rhodanobacteraceae bacterium]
MTTPDGSFERIVLGKGKKAASKSLLIVLMSSRTRAGFDGALSVVAPIVACMRLRAPCYAHRMDSRASSAVRWYALAALVVPCAASATDMPP